MIFDLFVLFLNIIFSRALFISKVSPLAWSPYIGKLQSIVRRST